MFENTTENWDTGDSLQDISEREDKIERAVDQDVQEVEWVPEDAEQAEPQELTESEIGLHTLDAPSGDPPAGASPGILKSRGFKVAAASAAALSVMGVSGLAHPQRAGEIVNCNGPDPVVEQMEWDETIPEAPEDIQEAQVKGAEAQNAETQAKQTESEESKSDPTKMSEEVEIRQIPDRWWHDVPTANQHGLTYDDQETLYGCAPTATQMILDYWQTQDAANQTLSAQALLSLNAAEGEFDARGMKMTHMHDELKDLGYDVQDYLDSDLDTLKAEVANGPVVATVKLDMAAWGENHSVVVTGISEDNQVRVNDPWNGESRTYSWQDFSRSWGADFGTDDNETPYPHNNFTVIRPS